MRLTVTSVASSIRVRGAMCPCAVFSLERHGASVTQVKEPSDLKAQGGSFDRAFSVLRKTTLA